jgi:uncharacterized membrane protein YkoI
MSLTRRVCLLTLVALTLSQGRAGADSASRTGRGSRNRDEDDTLSAAQDAVARGLILPLAEVMARLAGKLPGRVVGVEIEREDGRFVYEFKVIDARGRRREVYVDAATAAILKVDD